MNFFIGTAPLNEGQVQSLKSVWDENEWERIGLVHPQSVAGRVDFLADGLHKGLGEWNSERINGRIRKWIVFVDQYNKSIQKSNFWSLVEKILNIFNATLLARRPEDLKIESIQSAIEFTCRQFLYENNSNIHPKTAKALIDHIAQSTPDFNRVDWNISMVTQRLEALIEAVGDYNSDPSFIEKAEMPDDEQIMKVREATNGTVTLMLQNNKLIENVSHRFWSAPRREIELEINKLKHALKITPESKNIYVESKDLAGVDKEVRTSIPYPSLFVDENNARPYVEFPYEGRTYRCKIDLHGKYYEEILPNIFFKQQQTHEANIEQMEKNLSELERLLESEVDTPKKFLNRSTKNPEHPSRAELDQLFEHPWIEGPNLFHPSKNSLIAHFDPSKTPNLEFQPYIAETKKIPRLCSILKATDYQLLHPLEGRVIEPTRESPALGLTFYIPRLVSQCSVQDLMNGIVPTPQNPWANGSVWMVWDEDEKVLWIHGNDPHKIEKLTSLYQEMLKELDNDLNHILHVLENPTTSSSIGQCPQLSEINDSFNSNGFPTRFLVKIEPSRYMGGHPFDVGNIEAHYDEEQGELYVLFREASNSSNAGNPL